MEAAARKAEFDGRPVKRNPPAIFGSAVGVDAVDVGYALLRRAGPSDHLRFGDLVLEPSSRGAWRGSRPLALTQTEFALLEHFLRHPRQVLTREQLLEAVWAGEPESDNVVAVYVGYLRQKLEETGATRLIQTVRGTGYALREG